jgi:ankyrin repeat protein
MEFINMYPYIWIIFFVAFWLTYLIISTVYHVLFNSISKIHQAVLDGNIDLVRKYLDRGVDVDYRQNGGTSPLCLAASENRQEIAELLIDYGANINQGLYEEDGTNPLLSAAIGNHLEIVQMLLDSGAIKGLHLAALQGDINAVRTFIWQQTFQINSTRNKRMTPLHLAAIGGHQDIVALLLDNNADIWLSAPEDQRPFHQAVKFNRIKVVELMIDRGVDSNRPRALYEATRNNYLELVRLLINKGVDINCNAYGSEAPLHIASRQGLLEIAEILLASGAEVNIKDTFEKMTPLHYASREGQVSIVDLLIHNGAKINTTDGYLRTPLDYAVHYENFDVIDLLKQNGGVECVSLN